MAWARQALRKRSPIGRRHRKGRLLSFWNRFAREESGQAITEYVILLAFAVGTAIAFARGILGVIDKGILKLGGQLEKDLKTGRSPLSVWKN